MPVGAGASAGAGPVAGPMAGLFDIWLFALENMIGHYARCV